MDSLQTVSATSHVATAAATTPASSTTTTDSAKSFTELLADAKKDLPKGEKLATVKGHDYARIQGGKRDEQFLNLSGNTRSGEAFDLVTRNGRTFHVYEGVAADAKKVVVEIKPAADAKTTGGTTAPATTKTS
jgi:hypothetical protein